MEPPREGHAGRIGLAPGQAVGTNVLVRHERTHGDTQIWLARTTTFPQAPMTVRARAQDAVDRASPFAPEIELGKHLGHPSLLAARETIEVGPWSCVVTPGAPGVPLLDLYDALGSLRSTNESAWTEVVAHVVSSLLAGLDAAHRTTPPDHPKGIVHGGLRPELVEIAPDGAVRLGGFAVKNEDDPSRIVDRTNEVVAYVAPEQLGSRTRAPTMDLWSVGALLHELVDGRRFRSDIADPRELYRIALTGVVPPLQQPAPAALEQLRASLLARNPRERPRSAADAVASITKPGAAAITRLADLVRARLPADAPAEAPPAPPAPPPMPLDLSQVVPAFMPPPLAEEEGTVAIDPMELAAMRGAHAAEPPQPVLGEEDAPVVRRRPANVETPRPQPRAPAPPPTLHIPPPPPLEAPRAPEPVAPLPPRPPPTMAGDRIEFDPRVEGTSMTIRAERRAKRSFAVILAVAGVTAIVIGVVAGVLIAGDDTPTPTPAPAKADAKPGAKPKPEDGGPKLQPRAP